MACVIDLLSPTRSNPIERRESVTFHCARPQSFHGLMDSQRKSAMRVECVATFRAVEKSVLPPPKAVIHPRSERSRREIV